MSAITDAVHQAITEANAEILANVGAVFSGIEAWEGERLTGYAAMYYGLHRDTDESDNGLRARCQAKQRIFFTRSALRAEADARQIIDKLVQQNERKRVDLLAAQERIVELEAENSALRRRLSDRPALRDRLDELLKLDSLTDDQHAEIDRLNDALRVESPDEERYLDILRRAAQVSGRAERLQANIAEAHAEAMRLGPLDG